MYCVNVGLAEAGQLSIVILGFRLSFVFQVNAHARVDALRSGKNYTTHLDFHIVKQCSESD